MLQTWILVLFIAIVFVSLFLLSCISLLHGDS